MKYHHVLISALILFLSASHYLGYTPIAVIVLFLFSSVTAYVLYAKDKAAAKAGAWRVSENTLHLVAVLFGWPGALVAQERLRHKTKLSGVFPNFPRYYRTKAKTKLCALLNL